MISNTFKILASKFNKKTSKGFVFSASQDSENKTFSIPKSQITKFDQVVIHNPFLEKDEHWIEISVTQWIWNKANLQQELSYYLKTSEVVIDNQTHFGINWDYVIQKRRNKKACFFCHGKMQVNSRTKDHLIPRSVLKAYGYEEGILNNVVPCCLDCNQEKSNLHPELFRKLIKRRLQETGDPKYRIILYTLDQIIIA